MGLRTTLKKIFDRIVYRYAFVNRVLRNFNKKISGLTSFRLRPFGTMQVHFQSGIRFKMATNETSSVTKLLFWNGADNYEYTRIFESLLPRCHSFIDVGSNTGYYSLLAGTKNPAIRVFAFEPASAPFFYLEKNVNINRLKNVKIFPLALSDSIGEVQFFEVHSPKNYHNNFNLAGTGTMKGQDLPKQNFATRIVPTTTLDNWIKTENLPGIDLIKIDTEGTEHLILRGADHVLREQQPIIICETLFNVIEDEIENIMKRYDYHFFNHKNGKLFKTPTLKRESDNGFRDCFFVPSKKISWIEPFTTR